MKVALMQPYFFPYIGYFQLIHAVNEFIIFDNAQYIRRGWMNRNRILNGHKESIYINVPVQKAPRETKIKDIVINNELDWKANLFQQINYYRKAPNYAFVSDFLDECLYKNTSSLSQFNAILLKKVCNLLEIDTKITILSEKLPMISVANAADEWGVEVCKALNATTYINAIGGIEFYNQQKYLENNIEIQFIKPVLKPYKQFNQIFIPGLSIIDVMMFNHTQEIKEMLEIHELII
ncbi:WbqC family protein [Lysinibacillus sp. 54212]|uniref:WbqC family protein n=1 Tax=Lysinibacillus sp. 54212 TaxID=3119829 RepID=UPI002FC7A3BF